MESGALSVIQGKVDAALKENDGETIRNEKWDERDLAYEIEGYRRGTYHILTYRALPPVVRELEKHLGFHKSEVMRFITVSVDEDQARGIEPEKPPAPPEKKRDDRDGSRDRRPERQSSPGPSAPQNRTPEEKPSAPAGAEWKSAKSTGGEK